MKVSTVEQHKERIKKWIEKDEINKTNVSMSYSYQVGVLGAILRGNYMTPKERVKDALNYIDAMDELRNEVKR